MSEAFLKVVNMSISAGWLVLAVLALRLILKKAPKWVNVLLWGIVAIRLICPFSIESRLSLIPDFQLDAQTFAADSYETSKGQILDSEGNVLLEKDLVKKPQGYGQILDSNGNVLLEEPLKQTEGMVSALPSARIISVIWITGMNLMLAYSFISYFSLKRKVATATYFQRGIMQSEYVSSPFVLGVFRPVIYLPYGMDDLNRHHVVAHEQAHIRRKDHWWKPLGFLLLTVYWFNPLMWVAYILLCRDIELACDEKVIAELGSEQRADYTQALVSCAVNRRMIAVCPLAFGEVGVKDRVKSIMNYRKPTFWIIVTALVVCVAVAVCFLTDPNPSREFSMRGKNVSSLYPEAIVERILDIEDITNSGVYMNSLNFSLQVDSNFNWVDSQAIRYFYKKDQNTQSAQLRIFPDEDKYFLTEPSEWQEQEEIFLLRHYLEAIKYLPQYKIMQMAPADQYIIQHVANGRPSDYERVITYSSDGVQELDSWNIHLQIQPLHDDGEGYHGTGDEVIELFYGGSTGKSSAYAEKWFDYTEDPSEMSYEEELKIQLDDFPDIIFKYTPYDIVATTSWEDSDLAGRTILISGLPIWNAYFCDLTGDGLPEICSQVSYGSGMIDNRVVIFDYANGVSYKLEDRGYHDYYLRMNDADGYLYVDKRVYNSDELVSSGRLVFKDGCIQLEGVGHFPMEEEKAEAEITMYPTSAELRGLHAGALFVPINGSTYRYDLSEADPDNVTADELLDTFTEDTGFEKIAWEVYSVKEYPDKSAVLMISSNYISWLCRYRPARRCSDDALQHAIDAGYAVMEDGTATHGQDIWQNFYEAAQRGEPASVTVASYHSLDPAHWSAEYSEAFQEDYPCLYLHELSFNGSVYTLSLEDGTPTYEYLMCYTDESLNKMRYVLTHDNTVTWEQLLGGLVSSQMGAYIDHYSIYTECFKP